MDWSGSIEVATCEPFPRDFLSLFVDRFFRFYVLLFMWFLIFFVSAVVVLVCWCSWCCCAGVDVSVAVVFVVLVLVLVLLLLLLLLLLLSVVGFMNGLVSSLIGIVVVWINHLANAGPAEPQRLQWPNLGRVVYITPPKPGPSRVKDATVIATVEGKRGLLEAGSGRSQAPEKRLALAARTPPLLLSDGGTDDKKTRIWRL